jgi:hypothetical protein
VDLTRESRNQTQNSKIPPPAHAYRVSHPRRRGTPENIVNVPFHKILVVDLVFL